MKLSFLAVCALATVSDAFVLERPAAMTGTSQPSCSTTTLLASSFDGNAQKVDLGLTPELRRLVEGFQLIPSDDMRNKQLLYMGSNSEEVKKMDESSKTPENKVPGCLSTVYIDGTAKYNPKLNDFVIDFVGDSDGLLTAGLVALLIRGMSGNTAAAIQRVNPEFIKAAGISQSLTPGRNNGFLNMLAMMKHKAQLIDAAAKSPPVPKIVEETKKDDDDDDDDDEDEDAKKSKSEKVTSADSKGDKKDAKKDDEKKEDAKPKATPKAESATPQFSYQMTEQAEADPNPSFDFPPATPAAPAAAAVTSPPPKAAPATPSGPDPVFQSVAESLPETVVVKAPEPKPAPDVSGQMDAADNYKDDGPGIEIDGETDNVGSIEYVSDSNDRVATSDSGKGPKYNAILTAMKTLKPSILKLTNTSHQYSGNDMGGESHFDLEIVADCFTNLNLVKRHQIIYMMLGDVMPQVHAIQIQAQTPEEAGL